MPTMNPQGFIPASRIIGGLFLLTAIFPIALSTWLYNRSASHLENATITQGVIVEIQPVNSSDGDTMYRSVFEFTDEQGQTHRIEPNWTTNPASHAVGDAVEVAYDPANPTDATLTGFVALWLGAAISGVMSICPIITGLVFLLLIPFTIKRVWPQPPTA